MSRGIATISKEGAPLLDPDKEKHQINCQRLVAAIDGTGHAHEGQPPWFRFFRRPATRAMILVWWLACLAYGAVSVVPYFQSIGWDYSLDLPKALPGNVAMSLLYKYFPETMLMCDVGLLELTCEAGSAGCPLTVRHVGLDAMLSKVEHAVMGKDKWTTFDSAETALLMGMSRTQPSPQRYRYPSGRAEIFTICAGWPDVDFSKRIVALLDAENPNPAHLRVGLASTGLLADSTIESVKRDLPLIDCICVPAAFALMGYILGSGRLLVVAVINLVVAILTTFGVIHLICQAFDMMPDPTQINFVLIIGLGLNFDYSLFLLSRFITMRARGSDVEDSVLEMLKGVGLVVISSGLTLTLVFSSFLFLSSGNLVMAGLGCAVTTAVVTLVSLTVVPAVLLTCPAFFGSLASSAGYLVVEPGTPHMKLGRMSTLTQDESDVLSRSRQVAVWRAVTTWPTNIIVIVALQVVALCAGLPAWGLRLNNDISEVSPRAGVAYRTLQALQLYGPVDRGPYRSVDGFLGFVGHTDEFAVIVEAESSGAVRDAKTALRNCGYELTAEVAQKLVDLPEKASLPFRLELGAVFAPGWARGKVINFTEAMAWHGSGMFSEGEEDQAVGYMADTMRTCVGECFKQPGADGLAATIMKVLLPIHPSSHDGDAFIIAARALLKSIESEQHACPGLRLSFYLADMQYTVVNHDVMRKTFAEFKRGLPITIFVVFVTIALLLRSAVVPLRLLLTLFLPLGSVFGISVAIYQWGWFNWLGVPNVAASADRSFHWEVPIFCFALTIALALDYDLFVVIRIRDFRYMGYTMQASIIRALHETGPVVTGAGLMMAISFGGNLLAESTTLNQGGWLLASGVLIDTFVVRTLLVPALFSLSDSVVWWPGQPPVAVLDERGFSRELVPSAQKDQRAMMSTCTGG